MCREMPSACVGAGHWVYSVAMRVWCVSAPMAVRVDMVHCTLVHTVVLVEGVYTSRKGMTTQ